jgi:hypothetical protein
LKYLVLFVLFLFVSIPINGLGFFDYLPLEMTSSSTDLNSQATEAKIIGDPLTVPNPFKLRDGAFICYDLSTNTPVSIHFFTKNGDRFKIMDIQNTEIGSISGYNKVPIDSDTFNVDLSSGIYFYLIFDGQEKLLGKGKMAVLPQ